MAVYVIAVTVGTKTKYISCKDMEELLAVEKILSIAESSFVIYTIGIH